MIVIDNCEVNRCRQESDMVYSASKRGRKREVCNGHWIDHCDGTINLKSKSTYKKQ